ncbi:unnamed protein product [Closterium sp. NIES-54]
MIKRGNPKRSHSCAARRIAVAAVAVAVAALARATVAAVAAVAVVAVAAVTVGQGADGPPMFITLYFIVTHFPDSLRSVRDHFLSLDPTSLTVDLLKQHLLSAETSAVAVGGARGTPRTPFFEGCSPSPLAPSYASAAAVDILSTDNVGAASASAKHRSSKGKGGRGGGGGSGSGGGGSSGGSGGSGGGGSGGSGGGSGGIGRSSGGSGGSGGSGSGGSGGGRTGALRGGSGGGQRQRQQRRSETPSPQHLREWLFQRGASGGSVSCPYVIHTGDRAGQTCGKSHTQHRCFSRLDDAWRAEFGDEVEWPHWVELLRYGVAIFDLDYDVILSAMYALSASAEGDCYQCVPPDPGIEAATLGASESSLPGSAPAEALHTFTLDSGASHCFFHDSTTLTPLPAPVPVRLADPSGGPVIARSSTVLPCPARVSICTCTRTGRHQATFTRRPGSSLYTLATKPPQVAASAQVSASGQEALLCSCRLLSHLTLLWHHRLGHPSLPRLRGMHSRLLVSGLPRSQPPLPPSPAPPCLPCIEGRQRAAPHSSSFPPTTAPLQTLHMDSVSSSASGSVQTFLSCVCTLIEVDVTFDESVPFYRLFPYRSTPPSPPPLFLAPGPPPVDPFPPQGPAPSGVSQVDPLPGTAPVEPGGAESEGAGSGGAEPGGEEPRGAGPGGEEPGGAEPASVEPGGAESEGAESGGAELWGVASSGGPAGASLKLSPQQLRGWLVRHARLWGGATGAGGTGDAGAGGAGVTAGAGATGGTAAAGPGGARTRGSGAAGTGGDGGAGAGDPSEPGAAGAGSTGARGAGAGGAGVGGPGAGGVGAGGAGAGDPTEPGVAGAGGTGAGGAGAGGAGVGGPGAGGTGAGGAGAVDPGGTVRPRTYFVPLLKHFGGLTEHREPASCPVSPVCTARHVPRSRPPPVPGTHAMALRPSSVPLRVPLPAPPESSLPDVPDPESDRAPAASPIVYRLLATVVTDPSFESAAASALVAELFDFAAACRLDYATALVAESDSASPPSVGGECALGTDVLEDR